MSTPVNSHPILGYWVRFNPQTHQGDVGLQMDNDPGADVKIENLPPAEVAALVAILSCGGARLFPGGAIGARG